MPKGVAMAGMQRMEFRQAQSLVMTPQLVQAIKLLQLSHHELKAYVDGELERNPLLQAEGSAGPDDAVSQISSGASPVAPAPRGETGLGGPGLSTMSTRGSAARTSHDGLSGFETSVAAPVSLADHLERQLELTSLDREERAVGRHIIHSLDEAGYLRDGLDAIAERLGAAREQVERALAVIQTFDPAGIGARDLAECLALQLRERNRYDPAMAALLTRLDLVARRDFAALKRICGVDEDDLAEMLREIRGLEPKPGLAFGPPQSACVAPDIMIREAADGTLVIDLNPDTLPRILVDRTYHAQVSRCVRKDEDRIFLSDCLQSAHWLKRSLDQRARTILKVATEIVRRQEGFFRHGVSHLRPLTLKAVADEIGMHESTISRVAANKTFGTNRGVFEMKYFFTAAIAGSPGCDTHAAEAVRHRIRNLIEAESPTAILSDDALTASLKREGIDIARRTVAKYREALRIPSSTDRRRMKRSA